MQDLKNKSTFHEIKNQLSVCDLYLEIVKKTFEKENFKNDTVNRAIGTIENSLRAIENSMQELKTQINSTVMENINLYTLVEDVFLACKSYKNGKEIEFINALDNDTEIRADRNKMYSVMINLFKNAIEAIKSAGYVKIYRENSEIFIENNGEMIPNNIQNKLFEYEFTTKSNGSGLGLMLIKKYLDSQNFDIKLSCSSPDKTIFSICYKS